MLKNFLYPFLGRQFLDLHSEKFLKRVEGENPHLVTQRLPILKKQNSVVIELTRKFHLTKKLPQVLLKELIFVLFCGWESYAKSLIGDKKEKIFQICSSRVCFAPKHIVLITSVELDEREKCLDDDNSDCQHQPPCLVGALKGPQPQRETATKKRAYSELIEDEAVEVSSIQAIAKVAKKSMEMAGKDLKLLCDALKDEQFEKL